jgi:hypothetical protein
VKHLDHTPFVVLTRAFFARFFASETVTSDVRLRQTVIWVLAFLLTPGFILVIQLYPAFQSIVIRARRFHSPGMVDDWIEWIAFVFITYAMVTVGLIAVFVWDALNFDHRDAMVLGPVPLRARTIVGAKLTALAALLAIAAVPINLLNGLFFALETADQFGARAFVMNFMAFLVATITAAAFVFAIIVAVRGTVSIVAGPQLAAAAGSFLQFAFVVALLSCIFLSPAVWRISSAVINNPDTVGWLPSSWFVGLFERVRGSTRAYFIPLGHRALVATPLALGAAVVVSIVGFSRAMQHTVSGPSARSGFVARSLRAGARSMAGRDPIATLTSDFVLLTIARNRSVHTPIAMNAALGVAIALAALTRATSIADLTHPRTIVLWIPLLVGYWLTIGLRAATFVPSEHRAAWIFNSASTARTLAFWSGTRAAMLSVVLPAAVVIAGAVAGPLLGWRIAAWHAAFVTLVLIAVVEAIGLTIRHVPFTAIYRPGHAKLRTRWPLYAIGMFAVAVWPVRLELRFLGGAEFHLMAIAALVALAVHAAGRIWALTGPAALLGDDEVEDDDDRATVLNIGQPRTV